MLNAELAVDLPSVETLRRRGPLAWVQTLLGYTPDVRSGEEELTLSALTLLQGLYDALHTVGVTDAIAFLVDTKVIYTDAEAVTDDLALVLAAAQRTGLLMRRFTEMHLVLSHRDHGLHTLVDVTIHRRVMRGEEEMTLVLSSRIEALRITAGETASAYAARIRAFGEHPDDIEGYRLLLTGLQERLGDALRAAFPGAVVRPSPVAMRLLWPEEPHLGRLHRLRFGAEVEEPRYRPVPTRQHRGFHRDPYYLYYYDPYYDLTHWLLLDTLLHRPTALPAHVLVVQGHSLGQESVPLTASLAAAWASSAVSFDAAGDLHVADTIPDVADETPPAAWGSVDIAEDTGSTSDVSADSAWGGSDTDSAWGGSDVSDSSSSSDSLGDSSSC